MNKTILVALIFLVLLVLDWRYQLRSVRLGTAVLALVVIVFAQPNITEARRAAMIIPRQERVTQIDDRPPLSEYLSGVYTMERAAVRNARAYAGERRIGVTVLFWLARTAAFRRTRARRTSAASERENPGSVVGDLSEQS